MYNVLYTANAQFDVGLNTIGNWYNITLFIDVKNTYRYSVIPKNTNNYFTQQQFTTNSFGYASF